MVGPPFKSKFNKISQNFVYDQNNAKKRISPTSQNSKMPTSWK